MPLKYACFISYRGYEDNELAETLVSGLHKSLKNELDYLVGQNRVYRDTKSGMAPGALLPPTLSRDLCESACMVVVYGPDYFSRDSTWCTREFKAMLDLEASRLKMLPSHQRANGLLIIIVFRGRDTLPAMFSENRLVCFFDKYMLSEPEIQKHPELYPQVMTIANYIGARFRELNRLSSDPCGGCNTFTLPSDSDALQWLDEIENRTGTTIQQEPADDFPR